MERRWFYTVSCLTVASTIAALYIYSLTLHRKEKKRHSRYVVAEKPQLKFKDVLADNSHSPFQHLPPQDEQSDAEDSHPYGQRITTLLASTPQVLKFSSVSGPSSMKTPYSWIDNRSALEALSQELSRETVFAVDTEQHSIRSFLGFTALIQISTQTRDYLIDTIELHDDMSLLRPVFADKSICKVFHGADSDILWLQRDFHIYVVNLFDTARACDVLGKPHRSLAYLLKSYCGITPDKSFQRADWRIRPLPDAMALYARDDAHYLLYIADCLTAELNCVVHAGETSLHNVHEEQVASSLFEEAVRRSNLMTLQLYEKEVFNSASVTSSLLSRHYNNRGMYLSRVKDRKQDMDDIFKDCVSKLCSWRDYVARMEDESLRFVLSDQALTLLARTLPTSPEKIYDTISAADSLIDSSDDSFFMTQLPSPSSIIYKHISSFYEVLSGIILEDKKCSSQEERDDMNITQHEHAYSGIINEKIFRKHFTGMSSKLKQREMDYGGINKRIRKRSKESSRAQFVRKFSCKQPVYHNCRIYASDGGLLCYCDRKKLDWYLNRKLAELIEADPPAVKLLFEPKGRPEDENNDFYIQSKQNICVGCGEGSHYLRYRIIPSCYRMHFPEHLKSHQSHDIVLLCVDCHEIAHAAAEKYKRKIASGFGIPLLAQKVVDSGSCGNEEHETEFVDAGERGVSPLKLRTAAMALLRYGDSMPRERREQLESVIKSYYKDREITQKDLEAALLVGMGPREKRRFNKRGMDLKSLEKDKTSMNTEDIGILNCGEEKSLSNIGRTNSQPVLVSNTEDPLHDCLEPEESCPETDNMMDQNAGSSTIECGQTDEFQISESLDQKQNSTSSSFRVSDGAGKNISGFSCNEGNSKSTVSETLESSEAVSKKLSRAQKLSLLGHGPHGKRVVAKLLEENGEEGIREFCQQWRAVFVTAVKPRFLPAHWDINHSGRREFGDYSVYSPSKRNS